MIDFKEKKMTNAERMVKEYLEDKGYTLEYEKPLDITEGNRHRRWYPDFFIHELKLYVEVCGADRPDYYNRTRQIYKENNVEILFVETFKDDYKWQYYLDRNIEKYLDKSKGKFLTAISKSSRDIQKCIFVTVTAIFIFSFILYSSSLWFRIYAFPIYAMFSIIFLLHYYYKFIR